MKVLVIRLSSIGDIVLTTPVVRCMHEQLPNAAIHVLTKPQYAAIFEANPHVAQVVLYTNDQKALVKDLKAEGYDLVVDLHKNLRTLKLKRQLGVKAYSFPKLNVRKWVLVNFKRPVMPEIHIVDRYFRAVEKLNVKNDGKGLDYFIPDTAEIDVEQVFGESNYITVAMGAQYATKVLPIQKLTSILSQVDETVVLLGGKEDFSRAEEVVKSLPEKRILNFCGQFSLHQSADAVRKSRVILTNDTGLMHIAAAFDTQIVSVWGNTVPELGMYPYRPEKPNTYSIHQVEGLSCRPCSKIGFQECPKKHFKCMMEQDERAIVGEIGG
jgi:ADP-heptose:LPS heptosyltransferase